MACNTTEVKVNGVTTYCGISCRDASNWYIDGPTVKRGRRKVGFILADGFATRDAAQFELSRLEREGWTGEVK